MSGGLCGGWSACSSGGAVVDVTEPVKLGCGASQEASSDVGSSLSASGGGATATPRVKVALQPGHSLMDWIRLGRDGRDLTSVGGRVTQVTASELAKHSTPADAWMAVHGRVYNVTPYLDFHPGGIDEIMRGVGKDATELYDQIHNWVNIVSMLKKCYVGPFLISPKHKSLIARTFKKPTMLTSPFNGKKSPDRAPTNVPLIPINPTHKWQQTADGVTLAVQVAGDRLRPEQMAVDRADRRLTVTLLLPDHTYQCSAVLHGDFTSNYKVSVASNTAQIELCLEKQKKGANWTKIVDKFEESFMKTTDKAVQYRACRLEAKEAVSPDTSVYRFALPPGSRLCVPVGHHVRVCVDVDAVQVVKSYTVVPASLLSDRQDDATSTGRVLYLMVKTYPNGVISSFMSELAIGDSLQISDHTGSFDVDWLADCQHLLLFAAGTGFTPMCGLLLNTVEQQPKPNRHVHLVFFNKHEEDILWRDDLAELNLRHPGKLEVHHVLSDAGEEWTGLRGRIRTELTTQLLPTADGSHRLCVCGPAPFTAEVVRLAKQLKYTDDMIHTFTG